MVQKWIIEKVKAPRYPDPKVITLNFYVHSTTLFHFLKIYKVFAVKNLYNMYKLWSKAKIYEPILQFNILQYFP